MSYRGSCADMCPKSERESRFGIHMSIFEKDNNNQPNEGAMVKEYRRSGADQREPDAADLRTPHALSTTMRYLVQNILDDPRAKSQETALEWYDFMWDRLRAIRKDITQQNICDEASAMLVERCARFHVHCCYAMNDVKSFDVDMNKRNLNDCLQMLRQMYHDLKFYHGIVCANELEFQSYDVLLHLNEDYPTSNMLMKTSNYRSTLEMKLVIKLFTAYTNDHYYEFFQLFKHTDYMTSCILSLYANRMRIVGLKSLMNAFAPRQSALYPFEMAIESLGFDNDEDLKNFAATMSIDSQERDGKHYLVLDKQTLRCNESLPPFKSKHLVENKTSGEMIGQLVYKSDIDESDDFDETMESESASFSFNNENYDFGRNNHSPQVRFKLDEPMTAVDDLGEFRNKRPWGLVEEEEDDYDEEEEGDEEEEEEEEEHKHHYDEEVNDEQEEQDEEDGADEEDEEDGADEEDGVNEVENSSPIIQVSEPIPKKTQVQDQLKAETSRRSDKHDMFQVPDEEKDLNEKYQGKRKRSFESVSKDEDQIEHSWHEQQSRGADTQEGSATKKSKRLSLEDDKISLNKNQEDRPGWVEEQSIDDVNVVNEDDDEEQEEEDLRVQVEIDKRAVADMMPAGRFKVRTLTQGHPMKKLTPKLPTPRRKQLSGIKATRRQFCIQDTVKSLDEDIQVETNVNAFFMNIVNSMCKETYTRRGL